MPGECRSRRTISWQSEDALSRLLVGSSPDGRPVHLGDFATVDRRYSDPDFVVRVDGESTVLLAIEMQEGHNIVKFGDKIRAKLAQLRATLPPDLVHSTDCRPTGARAASHDRIQA